jgi:hypothetical protein
MLTSDSMLSCGANTRRSNTRGCQQQSDGGASVLRLRSGDNLLRLRNGRCAGKTRRVSGLGGARGRPLCRCPVAIMLPIRDDARLSRNRRARRHLGACPGAGARAGCRVRVLGVDGFRRRPVEMVVLSVGRCRRADVGADAEVPAGWVAARGAVEFWCPVARLAREEIPGPCWRWLERAEGG